LVLVASDKLIMYVFIFSANFYFVIIENKGGISTT
jgi:hypothetical protein